MRLLIQLILTDLTLHPPLADQVDASFFACIHLHRYIIFEQKRHEIELLKYLLLISKMFFFYFEPIVLNNPPPAPFRRLIFVLFFYLKHFAV